MGIMEMLAVISLYAFYFFNAGLSKAYTIFFTGFVVLECVSVYLVRWRYNTPLLSNKWLHIAVALSIALQFAVLYTDLGEWFQVVPLDLNDWLIISLAGLALSAIVMGAMKIEKFFIKPSS
jgi:Ca2+-transporting ATPase